MLLIPFNLCYNDYTQKLLFSFLNGKLLERPLDKPFEREICDTRTLERFCESTTHCKRFRTLTRLGRTFEIITCNKIVVAACQNPFRLGKNVNQMLILLI